MSSQPAAIAKIHFILHLSRICIRHPALVRIECVDDNLPVEQAHTFGICHSVNRCDCNVIFNDILVLNTDNLDKLRF